MTRIALIGLGAIGQELLRYLGAAGEAVEVVGALVSRPAARTDRGAVPIFSGLDALLATRPDLVVECASQAALAQFGARVLAAGHDLVAASVGALTDDALHERLRDAAQACGAQCVIVAGALAGIDALAAARHVGIDRVHYTRRAAPATWIRSGALTEAAAAALTAPCCVFEGNARDAARRFPKNANVAATIALAGVGFERTQVMLIADPASVANLHAIEAHGAFGVLRAELAARTIEDSTSSRIVAGSLARAVLLRAERIVL